jgi:hypothetical protein
MSTPPRWFRQRRPNPSGDPPKPTGGPLVVVVGPCAAGKSTLAAGLRRMGFRAMVSGQEHSDVPSLWRHADPDVVVALDVDLATIRQRRGDESWPAWLYEVQRGRLSQAEQAAAIHIDTTVLDADAVLSAVAAFLAAGGKQGAGGNKSS